MEKDLIIDLTKMPRPKVCHNGVCRIVGEKCELLGKVEWLPPLDEPEDLMPSVGDFAPYLDDEEMENHDDVKIEFVNEPFDMSRVICTT
jgi:hypothetical protein